MTPLQSLRANIAAKGHHIHARRASQSSRSSLDTLFDHTSGRWLWNEAEQLKVRHRRFDIPGLQQVACQAIGTKRCLSLKKIGEGNFNKAYRLEMEDGQVVIAKIPQPNAGPSTLTTSSEVATMEFARDILNIPVPKVLAWSATDQNPVQAEYIIMEEARGSQLHEVWKDLPLRKKVNIIHEFVEIERKLLSVSFDKVGSLYFRDSGVQGCQPAVVQTAPDGTSDYIASHYSVGPITRREFWKKQRSEMQYHGPWASAAEYLESIACREIDWIKSHADLLEPVDTPWQYTSNEQRNTEIHMELLQKYRSAIPLITPRDPEIVSSRLWHPDFHAGNIYIDDEARISCIIDWQGTWITPVFLGANPPLVLDYSIDMLMKLPDNFKTLDDATKDRLKYQVSQSILIHTYETYTAEKNPLMHKMMHHPHGQTLKRLEAFAGSTWDDCLFPLQECLISVEREWDHFNAKEPCPYHFSPEQIRQHGEEAEVFNKSQELWSSLQGVLTDEGYTSLETFPKAVEVLKDLRAAGLRGLKGEKRRDFDVETRWVRDLDVVA